MGRRQTRDPREVFPDLYRFIEADLTKENYNELVMGAAGFPVGPQPEVVSDAHTRPAKKHAYADKWRGPQAVEHDVWDFDRALELQSRLREELRALRRGDTRPLHTSTSRRILEQFESLKQAVYCPPRYVKEHRHADGILSLEILEPLYKEKEERVCATPGCEERFRVWRQDQRRSCPRCTDWD